MRPTRADGWREVTNDMASEPTTSVQLKDSEAKQFLTFREHFDLFQAMEAAGVMELRWGKATLNFAKGEVQSIQVESVSWKRGS